MVSFADLSQRLYLINDLILSDMICVLDMDESAAEATMFSKHVLTTKHWFGRISYPNKKRFLLVLLHDIRSAWALSLILKSIWNCRPKDAVMSVCEPNQWYSSYDEAPMDHNRTAMPVSTLKQTMKNDRQWFLTLEPEAQSLVFSELLTVAGGPAMWEVLRRAQAMYESYSNHLMQSISECIPVGVAKGTEQDSKNLKKPSNVIDPGTQQQPFTQSMTQGQKEVEANLAVWNATIKSLRDSLKLEELEMTFIDGTTKKVWKVNRPKPDVLETQDFLQLLPSSVGKKILSHLPQASLSEYAKVNKYWAYLIDEYRAELLVRVRINAEIARLNEIIMKYDVSFEDIGLPADLVLPTSSEHGAMTSTGFLHQSTRKTSQSVKASEKSGGYSLRYFSEKLSRPALKQKPIRNMKELNERLDIRGAIDENIWKWCENITAIHKRDPGKHDKKQRAGILKKPKKRADEQFKQETKTGVIDSTAFNNLHFPCPLMKRTIAVPLKPPLYKDPARTPPVNKPKRKMSDSWLPAAPVQHFKRYGLWSRDVSPLYPVFKIPSHQFPS